MKLVVARGRTTLVAAALLLLFTLVGLTAKTVIFILRTYALVCTLALAT